MAAGVVKVEATRETAVVVMVRGTRERVAAERAEGATKAARV